MDKLGFRGQFARQQSRAADVRFGSKADIKLVRVMSALPPKADIGSQLRNVRFVPKADIVHLVGSVREPGAVGVGIAVDAGKRHVGHPGPKPRHSNCGNCFR